MNWQPIETAPKDGRSLLLWLSDDFIAHAVVGYYSGGHGSFRWYRCEISPPPTHWMELPSAPSNGHSECSASGASHNYGPHGPKGATQCSYCGEPQSVSRAEAELHEMREGGNADDVLEASAHLERVKHGR